MANAREKTLEVLRNAGIPGLSAWEEERMNMGSRINWEEELEKALATAAEKAQHEAHVNEEHEDMVSRIKDVCAKKLTKKLTKVTTDEERTQIENLYSERLKAAIKTAEKIRNNAMKAILRDYADDDFVSSDEEY